MTIAVNTRLLLSGKLEGIGWYSFQVLQRLTRNNPAKKFIFLFDRPYHPDFIFSDNIIPVVIPPPSRHPVLWYIWFNFSVPYILKKYKADVFFSPDGFLSLNTSIKQIPVIHDINFEHYPKDLPWSHSFYYRRYFRKYAQIAHRIITISQFSRQDIMNVYHAPADKISVAYNGINDDYKPLPPEEQQKIRNAYTSGNPFFLYVGALHPRKNIARLIEAFSVFKNRTPSNVKLVLAGNRKWWTSDMEQALKRSEYSKEIIFTGRLLQSELTRLMASALALTYVPYFEGFGMPVLEAMRAGAPVITSDISSLPEIAGDCAMLVNPFDINSIARAMIILFEDANQRNELVNKGLLHAAKFSWDNTVQIIQEVLEL